MANDTKDLRLQFYIVAGILGFFVVILYAIVIDLVVKVIKLRKGDNKYNDEVENRRGSPLPPSEFSLPKPAISKSWQDNDADVRRQNDRDFNASKSWQSYPVSRNQQPRSNDYKQDDNINNFGYDDRNSDYRNPTSVPKVPQFRLPTINSNNQNNGFRRDFQRNY